MAIGDSVKEAISAKLEATSDASNSMLAVPSKTLSGTWIWDGTPTVLASDTSQVAPGEYIRLDNDAVWYEITSVTPGVSVLVVDSYGVGSISSGSTQSSLATVAPPPPVTGTGYMDIFADAIAEAFAETPHELVSSTVAGLPSASPAGRLLYVTDETSGAVVAFSDGAAWRRMSDRVVVSA